MEGPSKKAKRCSNVENISPLPESSTNENVKTSISTEPKSLVETRTNTLHAESDHVTSASPPRLMITKMVLENFKSYAGVKEIGPFHKCFSSIVGPNGSGKSNVIDAMLFVFGKRAKKLRLNKVSELIHNSDAFKDKPLQYARVSVHFQDIIDTGKGDEEYDVVPNSEIVVSRTAKQDNTSAYKLNGTVCTFKEVATYLSSKGIDLENNRFLILQGEVEMISMMPPKGKTENDEGLLEYLEEIIGSNLFVEDTNLAAGKVDILTEQRQEKLNRVKAVEKEKESLEGAKVEAESLLGKERDIRRKKNILFQMHSAQIMSDIQGAMEQQNIQNKELVAEQEKLKASDERVSEIEAGLAEQTSTHNRLHIELQDSKKKFASCERRDIKLREDLKHTYAGRKKIESKVNGEIKKIEVQSAKTVSLEENIPKLEEEVTQLSKRKAEGESKLESINEEIKGQTEDLRHELVAKNQELAPVKRERAVYQNALDTTISQLKLLEDSTSRAKKQLELDEKELASLDGIQQAKRSELASCEDELEKYNHRLEEAKAEEKVLANKEKVLAKKNLEVMSRLEETKSAQKSASCRSKAVVGILKAAQKGGALQNAGILGRLGDLACIGDDYDIAVSTACGMLDHIVVNTTAGAQKCLEYLRAKSLGRANFIPLEKMKKGAHDTRVETPEGAPRLFDLISVKKFAVSPAMYLAVGNTLVAPDLDTATRWAYEYEKRWRVVTVDGKLIETSGTMSGGGKSPRRGGMCTTNLKTRPPTNGQSHEDLSEGESIALEEMVNKNSKELEVIRSNRRALAVEIQSLTKQIKIFTKKIPKLSMEIAGCDTSREELRKRLPILREQSILSPADENRCKTLKEEVSKCKSDMASCAILASKLESETAKLKKSIKSLGGSKLKKQQAACDDILSLLNDKQSEIRSSKVGITSSKKAVIKAKTAQTTEEKELEKNSKSLEKIKNSLTKLEDEASVIRIAIEEVKERESAQREALNKVSEERDALKETQSKLKCAEIDLIGQIDNLDKQVKDGKKREVHWKEEINKLNIAQNQDVLDNEDEDDEEETTPGLDENETMRMDKEEIAAFKRKATSSSLRVFSVEVLKQYSKDEIKNDITSLENERDSLAKHANMGAIAEYRKKEADYLNRVGELDDVTTKRNDARREYEELRRKRLEKFMDGFGQITLKLKEMYQMITLGGDAELELVDSLDPFSEGIVFSVRPPKKSWKNIANLSGGEKTLSSLALVFALHHFKPTPLYVMDEIDAALDFKNVSIVANYIKERTKNAQFIIISLRNNMFELADILVGIYKTNNCTKSITINPRAFVKKEKLESASNILGEKTNIPH